MEKHTVCNDNGCVSSREETVTIEKVGNTTITTDTVITTRYEIGRGLDILHLDAESDLGA